MLRVFLDTSVLSDRSVTRLASELAEQALSGEEFLVSVLTHFQILWGYKMAGILPGRYEDFLRKLNVDVAPLIEDDAALAAQMRPSRSDLVDALISATVRRYDAHLWTRDSDFLKYLPEEKVRIV